jgi:hypothetical protein
MDPRLHEVPKHEIFYSQCRLKPTFHVLGSHGIKYSNFCSKPKPKFWWPPSPLSWPFWNSVGALQVSLGDFSKCFTHNVHNGRQNGWNIRPRVKQQLDWDLDKNLESFEVALLNILFSYPQCKSGSLSPNLTFPEFNMATKRPHSIRWRYQCRCSPHQPWSNISTRFGWRPAVHPEGLMVGHGPSVAHDLLLVVSTYITL